MTEPKQIQSISIPYYSMRNITIKKLGICECNNIKFKVLSRSIFNLLIVTTSGMFQNLLKMVSKLYTIDGDK